MNIAILGGSFDPPHKGHAAIANKLLKLKLFEQVWLMPCYLHPFAKKMSPHKKRLEMTKHLETDKIRVSDFEIRKKTISYSLDTLEALSKKYPKHKFSWIIGNDQLKNFTKWHNWEKIVDCFGLVVIHRPKYSNIKNEIKKISMQVKHPTNIAILDGKNFPPIHVSSTTIRKKARRMNDVSKLVPGKIKKYLTKTKLYHE